MPAPVCTMPLNGRQHHGPGCLVEYIGILEHLSTFHHDTFGIGLQAPAANQIVIPIHRSGLVAVQARPVAGERNEIPQTPLSCGRGSVWRTTTLGWSRHFHVAHPTPRPVMLPRV